MAETTQHKRLTGQKPPERVTIYAPDGSPHDCAPVDAREILASGNGYTLEPSSKGISGEQSREQQPINDDAVSGGAGNDSKVKEAAPKKSQVARLVEAVTPAKRARK